jgi:hypothetical protein
MILPEMIETEMIETEEEIEIDIMIILVLGGDQDRDHPQIMNTGVKVLTAWVILILLAAEVGGEEGVVVQGSMCLHG